MKKILLVMLIVLGFGFVSAQDVLEPPRLLVKDTLSILDTRPVPFIFGWNWGSPGSKLDTAMLINSYHSMNLNAADYGNGTKLIMPLELPFPGTSRYFIGRNIDAVLNGMALHLEPSITVNPDVNTFQAPKPGFIN